MRIRLEATTRSPASSNILVMAPVRLRRGGAGLMIEKKRGPAMTGRSPVLGWGWIGAPPSGARDGRQGSRLVDPFAVLSSPVAAFDPFPAGKQLPGEPGAFERTGVKQIETAVVRQSSVAPDPVGDQHVPREVGRIGAGREQDRLARIVETAGEAVREEAGGVLIPQHSVEPGEERFVLGND